MSNKLIAAGNSRLKKAADSAIDPAVPAELQKEAAAQAAPPATHSALAVLENSAAPQTGSFSGGRVLSPEDVQGTPEEQLEFVTARLVEIDGLGKRAEDFVVLNKGILLEVAQQRELHVVAGHTNFAQWAGSVLDVEEKYVFELLQDAGRVRTVAGLGQDLTQHLTKAASRKVVAEAITVHGLEAAKVAVSTAVEEAAAKGKRRPTAARLAEVVQELTAPPSIPPQNSGSEISDLSEGLKSGRSEISDPDVQELGPAPAVAELRDLGRAAGILRGRVSALLTPAAVKVAIGADPEATHRHLVDLGVEVEKLSKRLASAKRAAAAELARPVDAEIAADSVE
ncbi:hypothetical protein ACFWOG_17040 [Kitasatospora sp. NPDC058406]|uniref:hypothetical protein n=1 Tax=Kitasatospora sp. NPDC058406 TaxID=3346483 RepID=UPI003652035B